MYRHINVLPRRLGSLFLPHQFQPTSTGSTSSKMAENQGSGADKSNQGKEVNAVHDDAIWRQLITHELEWARNWQHKWGFMIDAYEELGPSTAKKFNTSGTAGVKSMIPTKKDILIEDDTAKSLEDLPDHFEYDKMTADEKKRFCLWSHQIRKLQLVSGKPYEKYMFPATRNQELGWWLVDAMERSKKNLDQSTAGKADPKNLTTLLDFKLGRIRK